MYALVLNDMRQPNIENITIVMVAPDKQTLIDFYEGEKCEGYEDTSWRNKTFRKCFKAGGPLEWYNAIHDLTKENDYWGGIWEVDETAKVGMMAVKA